MSIAGIIDLEESEAGADVASCRVHCQVDVSGLTTFQMEKALGELASSAYGFHIDNDHCTCSVDVHNVTNEKDAAKSATSAVNEHLVSAANKSSTEPPMVRVTRLETL